MTSDTRELVNRAKDERRSKDSPESGKHRSKKNTRRWCRGVVGREHTPECRDHAYSRPPDSPWKILACTTCGKVLDHYFMSKLFRIERPKPDWVVD